RTRSNRKSISTPTWTSTPLPLIIRWAFRWICLHRCSPSAACLAGRRTCSSSTAITASSGREPSTKATPTACGGSPRRTANLDERADYTESQPTKPATLHFPGCKSSEAYDMRWMVRKKKVRLPPGADERDRARFAKSQSYTVLLDDKVACKNLRCRKRFDISGVKTMAFLSE